MMNRRKTECECNRHHSVPAKIAFRVELQTRVHRTRSIDARKARSNFMHVHRSGMCAIVSAKRVQFHSWSFLDLAEPCLFYRRQIVNAVR